MAGARVTQLDGWRGIAVIGVMIVHWFPAGWRGGVPFEIGLFFFLTLTGFLITRILLSAREVSETTGKPWRPRVTADFLTRRFSRILLPCYAAMLLAWLLGAPDIRAHPWLYALHLSNFHMAVSPQWPAGTAPFWSLAMQVQFYLAWPFVVFLLPRRWLPWFFTACVITAPVLRWIIARDFPGVPHSQAITPTALDYFGAGALLAWLLEKEKQAPDFPVFRLATWLGFAGYAVIYTFQKTSGPLPSWGCVQQTFLSVGFAGLIARTLLGIGGGIGKLLDHPVIQHIGKLSYGLYLFHALAPMIAGRLVPFLWHAPLETALFLPRVAVFALISWGLAWLCWRWLEGPRRLRFLASAPRR